MKKTNTLPEFLRGTPKPNKAELATLEQSSTSWLKINEAAKEFTEIQVRQLLILEIEGRTRLDVLYRLKSRMNALRSERERKELLNIFPSEK